MLFCTGSAKRNSAADECVLTIGTKTLLFRLPFYASKAIGNDHASYMIRIAIGNDHVSYMKRAGDKDLKSALMLVIAETVFEEDVTS